MRKTLRNLNLSAMTLAVLATTSVSAQGPEAEATRQVSTYVVGQAKPPDITGRPIRTLSLDEAIQIALEQNLDLQVARMNPQSVDYQILSARAAYRPTLGGSYSFNNSTSQSSNTLDGVTRVVSQSQGFNGSLNQTMPWYGGRATVAFNNGRSTTNTITSRFNPNYDTTVRLSYSQPLLAGFRIDNQRNTLRTLEITRGIADIQLRTQIEQVAGQVRTSYWALRRAIEQIEIVRQTLEQAQQQLEDTRIRVEIGTLAPIETAQPEAQVAQQQQSLLNTEIVWRNAELNFKRLLLGGPEDALFNQTIDPTEVPVLTVQSVDIDAAIENAMANRTDVVQSRRNLDVSEMNLEVSQDSIQPGLDLSAGYTLRGTGGTLTDRNTGEVIAGGYFDALGAIGGFDTPAWNLSFNFSYPLGMAAAKANYARGQLGLEQSQAQLKAQELDIVTQVTNAGLNVENAYRQYLAAQASRAAQEINANAAVVRFDNGMATTFEVVTAQNSLRSARLSELNTIINYMNAVADFDQIQRIR